MAAKKRTAGEATKEEAAESDTIDDQLFQLMPLLRELLIQDSDRGAVLVAVCLIEVALRELVQKYFQLSSAATDSDCNFLLGIPPAPLGSSNVKAKLAFALGLIDKQTAVSLKKVLDIRNDFAHKDTPPPITAKMAADVLGGLPVRVRQLFYASHVGMQAIAKAGGGGGRPRTKLITACIALWHSLKAERRSFENLAKEGLIFQRHPVLISGAKRSRKK